MCACTFTRLIILNILSYLVKVKIFSGVLSERFRFDDKWLTDGFHMRKNELCTAGWERGNDNTVVMTMRMMMKITRTVRCKLLSASNFSSLCNGTTKCT